MSSNGKVILYASYQTGENLPGYVQFALKHLAETDFTVVLLTNNRPLSAETMKFLDDNGIKLYLTENHGFDFGMWRRFLKDVANGRNNFVEFNSITRLLLVNDSIVYFQNNFADFIRRAENDEVRPHLQSFFLYLKQEALGAFYLHLLETPEQETFYEVVHHLEIGMSRAFEEAEVQTASLYRTHLRALFAYPELIAQGGGFIKRKLLQRRFNFMEKVHFIRHGAYNALNADYHKMVTDAGLAPDFKKEWLPKPVGNAASQVADKIWQKSFDKVGWPLLRTAIKTKYKLLKKELVGDEYK